jgi:hypothetical protein
MKKMMQVAMSGLVAAIGVTGVWADEHNHRHHESDEFRVSRNEPQCKFRQNQREEQWAREALVYRYLANHPKVRQAYFSEQLFRNPCAMDR